MSIVAINLKKIIKQKGLKQKFVAEITGIPVKTFSNMLNGRKHITDEHIEIFVKALAVSPNDLFKSTA